MSQHIMNAQVRAAIDAIAEVARAIKETSKTRQ
jgi:hypothetical protein